MRWASALVLTGCIVSSHVGPGVLDSRWQEPRRDPDPTRDPTREQTTSPWVPEGEAAKPGTREYEAQRAAATIAAVLAGGTPLLTWYGTFEENLIAGKRHAPLPKPERKPRREPMPTKMPGERFYPPAPDEPTRPRASPPP